MIKIKTGLLQAYIEALNAIISLKIPLENAITLAKIAKKIEEEYDIFKELSETKLKALQEDFLEFENKEIKRDKDGVAIFKEGKTEEDLNKLYTEAMTELTNREIEIDEEMIELPKTSITNPDNSAATIATYAIIMLSDLISFK